MLKYRVSINGTNFLLEIEGDKPAKHGFYTTRYVEAGNPDEAENIAIELIKKEFKDVPLNELDDPPVLFVEEIVELISFGDANVPGRGATWYKEEDE